MIINKVAIISRIIPTVIKINVVLLRCFLICSVIIAMEYDASAAVTIIDPVTNRVFIDFFV